MELTRGRRLAIGAGLAVVGGAALGAMLWPGPHLGQGRHPLRPPTAAAEQVTITGEVEGLVAPGVRSPLNLSFDNPNHFPLVIEEVRVEVSSVDAPRAGQDRPCTTADYAVRQLDPDVPLVIGADRVTDLREADLPRERWPAVTLASRPVNQDGCKGATLHLTFHATGAEVTR